MHQNYIHYGAEKVFQCTNDSLSSFNAKGYAAVITQAAEKEMQL